METLVVPEAGLSLALASMMEVETNFEGAAVGLMVSSTDGRAVDGAVVGA